MKCVTSRRILLSICLGLFNVNTISSQNVEQDLGSKDVSETQYYLFTTASNDYYNLVLGDASSLEDSPFDDSKRVYIIIHGWTDNGLTDWVVDMKDSILSVDDSNVISVEWSAYADQVNYDASVHDMYEVANLTSNFIDWLISSTAVTSSDFHLIGHSLGAHCSGLAAKYVTSGVIDRVTGMDPAGPLFHDEDSTKRIDKSDASFVDIIHTNGCSVLETCAGLGQTVGHVDFFPNGGKHQPGCHISSCAHGRSHEYFTESITAGDAFGTNAFVSWPCADWGTFEDGDCYRCEDGCLEMGFYVDRSLEGEYYLSTEKSSPYALGDSQSMYYHKRN